MFIYIKIINLFYSYVSLYVNTIKASSRCMLFLMPDYGKSCRLNRLQLGGRRHYLETQDAPVLYITQGCFLHRILL